jgi:NAD(P)-dependent dehydrogenase (short-subunit alcohol dehydrogenase family)
MSHESGQTAEPAAGSSPRTPAVAVITGAADGIGWATAQAMAGQGWRVALLDLRADSVKARAAELGSGHLALACDVSDADSVQAAVDSIGTRLGRIDALINNAGISHRSLLRDTDPAVIRRVMEVNFFGSMELTHAALPHLIARRGVVAAVSSVAAGPAGPRAYAC